MPPLWCILKRSTSFKSSTNSDNSKDDDNENKKKMLKRSKSWCPKSIWNVKEAIINRGKRSSSPSLSLMSSSKTNATNNREILNPITHKITDNFGRSNNSGCVKSSYPNFVGTLVPTTSYTYKVECAPKRPSSPTRSNSSVSSDAKFAHTTCRKCGENVNDVDALETYHLAKHVVTELSEEDSSRKIVELICFTSSIKYDLGVEKFLKVHNSEKSIARFEGYREKIKMKASKVVNNHSRCLADGNELLRFHATTVACSISNVTDESSSSCLCNSNECGVCRILKNGFSIEEYDGVMNSVFTASSSYKAIESMKVDSENARLRMCLIICRVIAGRICKPLEIFEEIASHEFGFDSIAGKVNDRCCSSSQELYLLNREALLPCFVVTCKPSNLKTKP